MVMLDRMMIELDLVEDILREAFNAGVDSVLTLEGFSIEEKILEKLDENKAFQEFTSQWR